MNLNRLVPKGLLWRITLLMSVALLPLGLISVYQTRVVVAEAQEVTKTALLSETLQAASKEREVIQKALGAAEGLASIMGSLDEERCSETMRSFVSNQDLYIFAGFVRADGQMNCRSRGEERNFSEWPNFQYVLNRDGPSIEVNPVGAVTGLPVMIVSHPVRRRDTPVGIVSISIPIQVANKLLEESGETSGLKMAIINLDGDVIAATGGIEEAPAFLPVNVGTERLIARARQSFGAIDGSGEARYFAVASMIDDALILVGSWPTDAVINDENTLRARLAVFFPVLMWVTGMAVAVLGLQRLVIRHVKKLSSAMRQFALGDRRTGSLELDDPPEEIASAQRAFNRMALIIADAESRRDEDLRDKEVLLREVHHRVKNNLQLIASIMNMQSRNARSSETRTMLAGLQRRVRGLATLHRTLYTTPDMTTIDSAELIQTVVDDVSMLSADNKQTVKTNLTSFPLYPDQAVPLSMFIAEALTNAFKHAGADSGTSHSIRVDLEQSDDFRIRMTISNIISSRRETSDSIEASEGLGNRLMTAFARQLDGTVETEVTETEFLIHLTFTRHEFDPTGHSNGAH